MARCSVLLLAALVLSHAAGHYGARPTCPRGCTAVKQRYLPLALKYRQQTLQEITTRDRQPASDLPTLDADRRGQHVVADVVFAQPASDSVYVLMSLRL